MKFTQFFTVMVTVLGMIFIGFTMGMNKDLLVKWYNYGCYLATHNTQNTQEVVGSGELMNINIVKGETEEPLRSRKDPYVFVGTLDEIKTHARMHEGFNVQFYCTDDETRGSICFFGDPTWWGYVLGNQYYSWSTH